MTGLSSAKRIVPSKRSQELKNCIQNECSRNSNRAAVSLNWGGKMELKKTSFFIFLVALLMQPSWAEEQHANPLRAREEKQYISKDIKEWISKNFLLSLDFVEDRFGTPADGRKYADDLNTALTTMDQGDDSGIANVLAQLMDTVNPKMAGTIFKNAKEELLELNKEDPSKLDPPNKRLRSFYDRVLFALYSWPTKKEPKLAFCGYAANHVSSDTSRVDDETKFNAAFDAKFNADKKTDYERSKSLASFCYENKENKEYVDFLKKFTPEAEKVAKNSKAFQEAKKVFESEKSSEEEKRSAFAKLDGKYDAKALFAYAEQQRRSGWENDEKENLGAKSADAAYKIIDHGQHEGQPTREIELENGTVLAWAEGQSPSEGIEKALGNEYKSAIPNFNLKEIKYPQHQGPQKVTDNGLSQPGHSHEGNETPNKNTQYLTEIENYAKRIPGSDTKFVTNFKESVQGLSLEELGHFVDLLKKVKKPNRKCPVNGEDLGSMGPPIEVTVNGQTLLVCCKGCVRTVKKDPDKYFK